jgi:DNA-binding CsgD family transcriptional regulator
MTLVATPAGIPVTRARATAVRRERQPAVLDLVLAHLLRGEELAAELAARLVCDSDVPLAQLYEALRRGVYRSPPGDNDDQALRGHVLDERLVQLVARLKPAPRHHREPQAMVFSTVRRGIAAAIAHMLDVQGMPSLTMGLADLTANRRGAVGIPHQFPWVHCIVVDAAAAQSEELLYFAAMLQHLHLIGDRFNVVVLGDDDAATRAAGLHRITGLTFVHRLAEVMAVIGVTAESPLTDRERAVLEFVSKGATNQQTATGLGISIATVKTYLERAQVKLKTCDRASAVATALRRGWI